VYAYVRIHNTCVKWILLKIILIPATISLQIWHASDTIDRRHVCFFDDYRSKHYELQCILMRGMLVEQNNCANIYLCQSNYSKLAGCSYRKSLEAKNRNSCLFLLHINICLYVGKKTNQITFQQQKKRGDLSIQLFCMYEDGNLHDDWLFESTYRTALRRRKKDRFEIKFFLVPLIDTAHLCFLSLSLNQTKANVYPFSLVNIHVCLF